MADDRQQYRRVIDRLVRSCHEGQGQIGANRARGGIWNRNAEAIGAPDQIAANALLAQLTPEQREVVATLIAGAFESGVHETLVVLHEEQVPPFDDGYEGTPYHDLAGRLDDWPWPEGR